MFWANPCGEWVYDRCQSCGHVQLRQRPSREDLQRYYDAVYEYPEKGFARAVARRYVNTVEHAADEVVVAERRLLEVGCNTGVLLAALRGRGWKVSGTEPSRRFRAVAHSRGLDVRRSLADWADERFSLIICFHVLEHVPDVEAELAAIRQCLSAGGALVGKTPNAACIAARLFPGEWEWSSPPAHLRLFSGASLRSTLDAAGFEARAIWCERGNARPLPFQLLRALALRLRGRSRRYTPGLDSRHVPVAGRVWYRAAEHLGAILGALGAPLTPIMRAVALLPELTFVATPRR